ncbi:MAG: sugar ABC transporter substrate-binding protein [Treponema sp.]|jgi:ribose transport system substrate-binding protein|nr:sugar ABC transporter substrate-binding protein [Treponema sp.]
MGKRILIVVAGLLVFLIFLGCQKDKSTGGTADSSKKNITVVLMALNSDYWGMMEDGAKIAGKEFGYNVNVIAPTDEANAIDQMNMVEDLISKKVSAIVLAPSDSAALVASAKKAKDNGIPFILVDSILDDDAVYDSYIGTPNFTAGKMAGEYLASKLKPGDKVGIIRGMPGRPNHDGRTNGALEAFKSAGINVVAVQSADGDMGKSVTVAENILQSTPDIKAIYCTADTMALGSYQTVEGLKKQGQIMVFGFDGSGPALDSIAAGQITGTLAQMPIELGYLGVKAAIDRIEGRSTLKTIDGDTRIIDADTVNDFKSYISNRRAQAK